MRFTRLSMTLLLCLLITACNFSPVKEPEATNVPGMPVNSDRAVPEIVSEADNTKNIQGNRESLKLTLLEPEQLSEPPDDLWMVIRKELSMDRNLTHKNVQAKLAWFARNQEYLDRVTTRATPYLYHIVTEIKRRGLPMELVLLPIVESAYQPFAYSPSRASGIWQFIPGTGKRFGLKQNWWYDGRRDIISATDAAFKYLEKLNQQFNGDWELALAAYNVGEVKIERAVKRNLEKGKRADFWSLNLPRETENYVPNLMAIAEIIAHPDKYNVHLKPVANKPYFSIVNIDGQIDLAKVAELSGLDMDEIYTLNPGFSRWATDPKGPHRLLLPVNIAADFELRLASIPPEERITWERYTIQQGDTLGAIAARHKTSVAVLKDSNQLRSNRIRTGKALLIPVSSKPAKHYTLSQEARRFKNLKSSGDGNKYTYTVKRGDTLWDIGRHYGISINQLCQWNGIRRNKILRLGQKIDIYVREDEQEGKILPAVAHSTDKDKGLIQYEVQEGDSLWLIARKFGVSVAELRKWNNLKKNRHLQPGQNIDIYSATTGV